MKRFGKRVALLAGIHLVATLAVWFSLGFDDSGEGVLGSLLYFLWINLLQPVASVYRWIESVGFRLPASRVLGVPLLVCNSLVVASGVACAWTGVEKLRARMMRPTTPPTVPESARGRADSVR
jgi:hypothetical protein